MSFLKKPFRKLKEKFDDGPEGTEKVNGVSKGQTNGGVHTPNGDSQNNPLYKDPQQIAEERRRKSESKERKRSQSHKRQSMAKRREDVFIEEGPEEIVGLYKPLSMNQSKKRDFGQRFSLKDIEIEKMEGETITFRARIHTLRRMSAKLVFIVFRQQTTTVQGVLQTGKLEGGQEVDSTHLISERMVRAVEHFAIESVVLVTGTIRKPPQAVKNATLHDAEIAVQQIHLISHLTENVPFTVYDAENITKESTKEALEGGELSDDDDDNSSLSSTLNSGYNTQRNSTQIDRRSRDLTRRNSSSSLNGIVKHSSVSKRNSMQVNRKSADMVRNSMSSTRTKTRRALPQQYRLNNRVVDLRTACSQSIFRIQSGVCNSFRSYLDDLGFIEIHTPKLQGGATESGASVFEVKYFGRSAFLAQSPQLAKQMCIAADFEKVYEIGPVFRAEDSNTPRHLTEYTGLDIEMALDEHYHEALEVIDGMFKNLWKTIYEKYSHEIGVINEYFPHEKVLWLEKTPRIPFWKGIELLKEDGWVDEDGNPPKADEDLATRAEIRLGAIVREKYKTDYYILDKFPVSARPFYTMPDAEDDRYTNSFDIFMRGQEILSGGQRIHDAKFLEQKMRKLGLKPETMEEYMEGFRWGAPPHAGAGIGLERLVYLFLSLGNIRLASLFPRDPKSLPARPVGLVLRHPEASTTNPPWHDPDYEGGENHEYQPLEKLIANYGDAANTSWLDKRYEVWRHPSTGAAQGFVVHKNFAILIGEPLCARSQYPQVVSALIEYFKTERKNLHPIWMICNSEIEEYVGEKFNWRTLSAAAENRVDPRNNPALKDHDMARKIRHAENENVKMYDLPFDEPVPEDFKKRVDERIVDWHAGRKGKQIHLTQIRPWLDEAHRHYFYAADGSKDGKIHAVIVMHQLSPAHGYQVKFSLDFPGAPNGTIESLTMHAMNAMLSRDPEIKSLTFGTGASSEMQGGRNLNKTKVKALKKSYDAINKSFKLTNKSEFREKLGAKETRSYVCYPQGGLGASGIKAIIGFLEEEG